MKELSSYPNPTTKQNISMKWNAHPHLPQSPSLNSNFQKEHLTFYETSENMLCELKQWCWRS